VDRIIDDFIGKKFGAGEKFYGKRTSGLSEDEYNDLIYQGKTVSAQGDKMAEYDRVPMKANAMWVVELRYPISFRIRSIVWLDL